MDNRKTPTEPTDWELGNELLHGVLDNLLESAKEMDKRYPPYAAHLRLIHDELIPMYRHLTGKKALL